MPSLAEARRALAEARRHDRAHPPDGAVDLLRALDENGPLPLAGQAPAWLLRHGLAAKHRVGLVIAAKGRRWLRKARGAR